MPQSYIPEKPSRIHSNIGVHIFDDMGSEEAFNRIRSAASVQVSPDIMEKMYMQQLMRQTKSEKKQWGDPSGVCAIGVLLMLTPLTCDLLGWRGSGGHGAANNGMYMGGSVITLVGAIMELLLGNTFASVVYFSLAAFFFGYGCTLIPAFNASGMYAADPINKPNSGLDNASFDASIGFLFLWLGLMSLVYTIASLRTNVVLVVIFLTLVFAFCILAGEEWALAMGYTDYANELQLAAGSFLLICALFEWYCFLIAVLESVDFPVKLPVGDLSHVIISGTDRAKLKMRRHRPLSAHSA